MVKRREKPEKVVLDTNVLVSALLFRGRLSALVGFWKEGRMIPVVSRETFDEFRSVLKYPKFSLSVREINTLIEEEVLPFFEVVDVEKNVTGICRDPGDDKFVSCALSASARWIVSGDKDLCDLGKHGNIGIIPASDFIKLFK